MRIYLQGDGSAGRAVRSLLFSASLSVSDSEPASPALPFYSVIIEEPEISEPYVELAGATCDLQRFIFTAIREVTSLPIVHMPDGSSDHAIKITLPVDEKERESIAVGIARGLIRIIHKSTPSPAKMEESVTDLKADLSSLTAAFLEHKARSRAAISDLRLDYLQASREAAEQVSRLHRRIEEIEADRALQEKEIRKDLADQRAVSWWKRLFPKAVAALLLVGAPLFPQGFTPIIVPDTSNVMVRPGDSSNNAVRVVCITGCTSGGGGGTSSTFGNPFPATGTAAGFIDSSGDMAGANLDAGGNLKVTASNAYALDTTLTGGNAIAIIKTAAKGATTAANPTSANVSADVQALHVSLAETSVTQPVSAASLPLPSGAATSANQSTEIASLASIDGKTPALGQALAASSVPVVLTAAQVTTLTSTVSQASTTSGQSGPLVQGAVTTAAPTYTNGQTDPLSLTTAGALRVDASGSTQPISGTVTVVQPTGTNLHAVLDTTSTTAVTQATASNLNATVSQGTGTNLHVVTDATSTTAVTQATATNLNAAVVGTGTAGSPAGNILTVQGVASMTKLLVTPDSVALPANQSVNLSQVGGTNTVTGGVAGSQGIGGLAASGATKSGNPVQVGGVFNTTPPTVTNGQAVEAQYTARGEAHGIIRDAAGNLRGANVNSSNELTVSAAVTSFPDNEPINVAQMNGVTVLMGNGATGTGSQRVTIANDSSAIAVKGEGATGAAPPSGAQQIAGVGSGATGGFLLAPTICTEYANINQTAGAQIITGVASRRTYICSLNLVTATAQNIAVVAGTGTVCATNTVAVPGTSGGTTAATGWNLAANSGIVIGVGLGAIAKTTVNADNVCILQSGSGQLSGGISYAIY